MKKSMILLLLPLCAAGTVFAQTVKRTTATKTTAAAKTAKVAKIEFHEPDNLHDFGTIPEGPDVSYSFTFRNTGNTPLLITNAQANCGCTSPTFSREPVAPGKTGKIGVTYHTKDHPGNFTKFIYITSNAEKPEGQAYTMLSIRGIVVEPAEK